MLDPRLFERSLNHPQTPANQRTGFTLTNRTLLNDNQDAGWRLLLIGQAGQLLESWDSRDTHSWLDYDDQLRLLAQHEQAQGQPPASRSRFSYAGTGSDDSAYNRCGRLVRLDDSAGSVRNRAFTLSGEIEETTRQWLASHEQPDWPLLPEERDALLVPGPGATTLHHVNALAEPVGLTDALGNLRRLHLDVAGQLKEVVLQRNGEQPSALASAMTYSASGQLQRQRCGNEVVCDSRYDPRDGRLVQRTASHPQRGVLQALSFVHDPGGRIVEINDGAQPIRYFRNQKISARRTFVYDSLYRLTRATGFEVANAAGGPDLPAFQSPPDPGQLVNYQQHYQYDSAGNLIEMRHVGAHNRTRRLAVAETSNCSLTQKADGSLPDPDEIAAAFDANGNLKFLHDNQALQWNANNQLRQVTLAQHATGDDVESYRYDLAGQRQYKRCVRWPNGTRQIEETFYLPGLELHRNSASGEVLDVLLVDNGLAQVRLLHWQTGLPTGLSNDRLRYSLVDQQGSTTLELDDQARTISHEAYYPYGGTCWWAGESLVEASYKTRRYSAKERDASGLYYYGMRYYAPWLRRWINPDPGGIDDGLNLFTMVRGDPVGNIDRQGLDTADNQQQGPTVRQVVVASSADATRITVGFLLGSALTYFIEQALDLLPADLATNATLTAIGMLVGGSLLGVLGRQIGQRFNSHQATAYASLAIGVMAGIAMPLAGFWNRQQPERNDMAVTTLMVAARSFVQQFAQLALANVGPKIAPAATIGTAAGVALTAVSTRSISGYFGADLAAEVRRFAIAPASIFLDWFINSAARSRQTNARYVTSNNQLSDPQRAPLLSGLLSRNLFWTSIEAIRAVSRAALPGPAAAAASSAAVSLLHFRGLFEGWLNTAAPARAPRQRRNSATQETRL
ncbi:hypothetical protein BHU25_25530 [Pseudomonas vranovensis]|uniref:Toxin n=2 Tax=Pseudomonas vranovensis TaxID=321661 RepID=A0A423CUN7_9PSED|nr:hypothetical protein BHU25_25530 [Pseudomonas vranovensis]